MPLDPDQIPDLSIEEAAKLARNAYGIEVSAEPLPSDRDQNFFLKDSAGHYFVLKIANRSEERNILDAQNAALDFVHEHDPDLECPKVCKTSTGVAVTTVVGHLGHVHLVRMLTFVPGELLSQVRPHTPEVLRSLGAFFGRLDKVLEAFSHEGARRYLEWDLNYGPATVRSYVPNVEDADGRTLIERHLEHFETTVAGQLMKLRTSVIHNDGNDYNVLVHNAGRPDATVGGVIDFGDIVETCTVFELAVAAAYALLDKPDPVLAAAAVTGGYHSTHPVTEGELDVLFDHIVIRLCMSVCVSAYQSKQNPGNEYLVVSQRPAWEALHRLTTVDRNAARMAFHAACSPSE